MRRPHLSRLAWLLCLAGAPLAQAADGRGGYMGASLGAFEYDEGSDPGSVSDDTSQYELFGGYRLTRHFGLEFGWTVTGDIDENFVDNVPGLGPTEIGVSASYDIYSLKAVGFLPFDRFSLFSALGYYSASLDGDVSIAGFGTVGTISGHERGSTIALGIQRDFKLDLKSLSIRADYQVYDFSAGVDVTGLSVGMLFRF